MAAFFKVHPAESPASVLLEIAMGIRGAATEVLLFLWMLLVVGFAALVVAGFMD